MQPLYRNLGPAYNLWQCGLTCYSYNIVPAPLCNREQSVQLGYTYNIALKNRVVATINRS